jgi:CRISPR/Cas system CSM-associated protein Csm3 (group 7 of RAMP superfamily)
MNPAVTSVLSDPGGVRPIVARWIVEGDLILESATHLGGESGDATDIVVLRDARTGRPLLPGTTIAGALRSYLADVLGGYGSEEDPRIPQLFGAARGDDMGHQSPLVVFDSLGTLPEGHSVEIRDGVQINLARGTAEDRKKFDLEVLPAGTRFRLRFDLLIPTADQEEELLNLLVTALGGLSSGEIALGARRSRGLGAVRTEGWRSVRYNLSSREGWISWILSDAESPTDRNEKDHVHPAAACQAARPGLVLRGYEDRRRRIVADLNLCLKRPLLVRSAPMSADAPDAAHVQSAGRSVLPGTSLAGVFRNQALRIAQIVRQTQGDAALWVEHLFGPRMEGTENAASTRLKASRLRISESAIDQGTRARQTRVRIDRFTQGVVPGALFDEEVEHAGTLHVRVELRNPQPGELGLLILLLKDLLGGYFAVGGTSAVGRGVMQGTASLRLENGSEVSLDPGKPADPRVDSAIQELWDLPSIGGCT